MDNAELKKIKDICDLVDISTPGELLKNSKYLPDYILNYATRCEELRIVSEKRFAAINNTFANDRYYNNGQKGNQRLHGGSCTFIKRIDPYTTGESYINVPGKYVGSSGHGNQSYYNYTTIKSLLDAGYKFNENTYIKELHNWHFGYNAQYADWPSAQLVGHFHEDYYVPLCDSVDKLISELTRFGHEFSFELFVNNHL